MSRTKRAAKKLAKQIIEFHEYVATPAPDCGRCRGKGSYPEIHPHDRDEFDMSCDCSERDRPYFTVDEWNESLVLLAKAFLGIE